MAAGCSPWLNLNATISCQAFQKNGKRLQPDPGSWEDDGASGFDFSLVGIKNRPAYPLNDFEESNEMAQKISVVDAFADRPFGGNPAAVCVLAAERPAEWMQAVAAEMNLSETAFLVPHEGKYQLRWFTPRIEVPLCGHGTLASAHVLWSEGHLPPDQPAIFQTLSGCLTANRRGAEIEMDFPRRSLQEAQIPPNLREDLSRALGAVPVALYETDLDWIAELESESVVRNLRPDLGRVASLPPRGVIVTARSATPGIDFVSRFFVPQAGIPEDPVTGSAHCCLAPLWQARLGKSELVAYQASARGGTLKLQVAGPRVRLAGKAITILRGELCGAD